MDFATLGLQTTIRPRLLVVAARHGLAHYDRALHLARILGLPLGQPLPAPGAAQDALVQREAAMDHARRHHDASWHPADHVMVMTALLHEAKINRSARAEALGQIEKRSAALESCRSRVSNAREIWSFRAL